MFRRPSELVNEVLRVSEAAARNPQSGPAPPLPDTIDEYRAKGVKRLRDDAFPLMQASYQSPQQAAQTLSSIGYTIDPELSSDETKVAINQGGDPVVLHRGSKTARDWLVSDTSILAGAQAFADPRLKRAREITDAARDKYEREPGAVGHSLGGRLAQVTGARGPVVTYNAAAGLGDIGREVPSNVQNIRSPGDIVSLLSRTQRQARPQETLRSPQDTWMQQFARALQPSFLGFAQNVTEAHRLSNLVPAQG